MPELRKLNSESPNFINDSRLDRDPIQQLEGFSRRFKEISVQELIGDDNAGIT